MTTPSQAEKEEAHQIIMACQSDNHGANYCQLKHGIASALSKRDQRIRELKKVYDAADILIGCIESEDGIKDNLDLYKRFPISQMSEALKDYELFEAKLETELRELRKGVK